MTERQIVLSLMRSRYRRNFCVPNYTPAHWWECDLFEMTPAGVFREYEVKISRGDFMADAKKWMWGPSERVPFFGPWEWSSPPRLLKHELLARRDLRCPSQFWYVTPSGLLKIEDIPEWAGLIEMGNSHYRGGEKIVKAAPKLNKLAVSSKVDEHVRGICYWRMHNLLTSMVDAGWNDEATIPKETANADFSR